MAQLVVGGKALGVHPFFVQLRSLSDHKPLPGVTLGDIGPKLGFNSTDNGFCRYSLVHTRWRAEKPSLTKREIGSADCFYDSLYVDRLISRVSRLGDGGEQLICRDGTADVLPLIGLGVL